MKEWCACKISCFVSTHSRTCFHCMGGIWGVGSTGESVGVESSMKTMLWWELSLRTITPPMLSIPFPLAAKAELGTTPRHPSPPHHFVQKMFSPRLCSQRGGVQRKIEM